MVLCHWNYTSQSDLWSSLEDLHTHTRCGAILLLCVDSVVVDLIWGLSTLTPGSV